MARDDSRPDAQSLGFAWERRAAEYLTAQGIRIIARGYRCRLGELDIVASDGRSLIVVEVRARASRNRAIQSIGNDKRRRIINATRHFVMRNPKWNAHPIRFDVITIDRIDRRNPEFRWIRNAFDAS